jgi:putative transcriptional regulator
MTHTPDTIKALRVSLGLTQEDFAHEVGVTCPTVNRWERGHAKPSKHTAKLLDDLARASLPEPA